MVNLPFVPLGDLQLRSNVAIRQKHEVLQLFWFF